jgi:hypothetical protein
VTFTATVTATAPGAGTPTGTVTFKNGATVLGTVTLNSSGHATLTHTFLKKGNYPITVIYNGDANFSTSTSPTLTQVVNRRGATVLLPVVSGLTQGLHSAGEVQWGEPTITVAPSGPTSAPTAADLQRLGWNMAAEGVPAHSAALGMVPGWASSVGAEGSAAVVLDAFFSGQTMAPVNSLWLDDSWYRIHP